MSTAASHGTSFSSSTSLLFNILLVFRRVIFLSSTSRVIIPNSLFLEPDSMRTKSIGHKETGSGSNVRFPAPQKPSTHRNPSWKNSCRTSKTARSRTPPRSLCTLLYIPKTYLMTFFSLPTSYSKASFSFYILSLFLHFWLYLLILRCPRCKKHYLRGNVRGGDWFIHDHYNPVQDRFAPFIVTFL